MKEKLKNNIKNFAKKMGYEIIEGESKKYNILDEKPMYFIEIVGISTPEGNPYIWTWCLDIEEKTK